MGRVSFEAFFKNVNCKYKISLIFQYPANLLYNLGGVVGMIQNIRAENNIKETVRKRDLFP